MIRQISSFLASSLWAAVCSAQLVAPAAGLPIAQPAAGQYTPEEMASMRAYEIANHSVVSIDTSAVEVDRFFGLEHESTGSGSGSVVDRQGHIVTNFHVVEGAQKVNVTLNNKDYEAKVVGADAEYDIAVLKIEAPAAELFPITLGNSESLRVGQKTYVLGNPFGLGGTLTTGIVSSLNRSLPSRVSGRDMQGLIQTDAAMNPGNSGGPLLDSSGRMIGMNVAIASKSGQSAGVGFAIPVDRIRRYLPELLQNGKLVRPYHGIVNVIETADGLRIVKLSKGGPAELAGLKGWGVKRNERRAGPVVYVQTTVDRNSDTIVAIDNEPVKTSDDFLRVMENHRPGDTVNVTVLRDGQQLDVALRLGAA